MSIPEDEGPDIAEIRRLAEINLPAHLILKDVRLSCGSDAIGLVPNDAEFEVIIEYESRIEEDLARSDAENPLDQEWSHALMQDIRKDWPPETLRISFIEQRPRTGGMSS